MVNTAFSDLVLAQGIRSATRSTSDTNHIVLILYAGAPAASRDSVCRGARAGIGFRAATARDGSGCPVCAKRLLARLEGGEALEDLAAENALEVVVNEAATRTMTAIDSSLRSELFLMEKPAEGSVTSAVVEVREGYAVVRLDSVTDGVLAEGDVARIQAYSRRIASASATDEALGFIEMLRAQSTIEVFEDRLR